jgi:RNA polymerase sigma-70 factor, ECF subfamily
VGQWLGRMVTTPPGPGASESAPGAITRILREAREGDRQAFDRLLPLLYSDLRQLAQSLLLFERCGHTLQATALVHEMWLKLAAQDSLGFEHRRGFFSAAATAMRRILCDHARGRKREKRGAGVEPVALDESVAALERSAGDLVALDEALTGLAELDERKAKLVELRFFVGLPTREAAEVLAISERQAERELVLARAWLKDRLDDPDAAP